MRCPAGAAALGIKGIADVASGTAFGGPADQQEPNQLDVGNVVGTSALLAGAGAGASALTDKFSRGVAPRGRQAAMVSGIGALGGAATSVVGQALFE